MRVLVTRPQPAGERLARRLQAAGHQAFSMPVIETIPVRCQAPQGFPDALVFLSPAAVRHGWPLVAGVAQGRPVLAIGRATADALAERGCHADVPQDERSEGLLALCRDRGQNWRSVWLVRGRGGRELLPRELARLGMDIALLEVYERRPVADPFAGLHEPPEAVVVTSGEVFDAFDAAWRERAGALRADPFTPAVIVNVRRVAQMARASGYTNVLVADGAGDEAILTAVSGLA